MYHIFVYSRHYIHIDSLCAQNTSVGVLLIKEPGTEAGGCSVFKYMW
jgi:hypothetical protein